MNHITGFAGQDKVTPQEKITTEIRKQYQQKMYKNKTPFPKININDQVIFDSQRYTVLRENNSSVIIQPLDKNLPIKKVAKRQLVFLR